MEKKKYVATTRSLVSHLHPFYVSVLVFIHFHTAQPLTCASLIHPPLPGSVPRRLTSRGRLTGLPCPLASDWIQPKGAPGQDPGRAGGRGWSVGAPLLFIPGVALQELVALWLQLQSEPFGTPHHNGLPILLLLKTVPSPTPLQLAETIASGAGSLQAPLLSCLYLAPLGPPLCSKLQLVSTRQPDLGEDNVRILVHQHHVPSPPRSMHAVSAGHKQRPSLGSGSRGCLIRGSESHVTYRSCQVSEGTGPLFRGWGQGGSGHSGPSLRVRKQDNRNSPLEPGSLALECQVHRERERVQRKQKSQMRGLAQWLGHGGWPSTATLTPPAGWGARPSILTHGPSPDPPPQSARQPRSNIHRRLDSVSDHGGETISLYEKSIFQEWKCIPLSFLLFLFLDSFTFLF